MPLAALLMVVVAPGCGSDRRHVPPTGAPEVPDPLVDVTCETFVEGPQADGECTTDADCGRGGCGNVVCTTAPAATDLMTTCEERPCFAVLDRCGCHDGRCTWTLRAEAAARP